MSEQTILEMLEKGVITADQAAELLQAANAGQEASAVSIGANAFVPAIPPQVRRRRWLHYIPLLVTVPWLAFIAWSTYTVYRHAARPVTFGVIAMSILLVLSAAACAVSIWILLTPWLHLRVQEGNGRAIKISFPLPLTLAGWGIGLAKRLVDEKTRPHLDTAAAFIQLMRQGRRQDEPIYIDIDQGDQQVQIYIG